MTHSFFGCSAFHSYPSMEITIYCIVGDAPSGVYCPRQETEVLRGRNSGCTSDARKGKSQDLKESESNIVASGVFLDILSTCWRDNFSAWILAANYLSGSLGLFVSSHTHLTMVITDFAVLDFLQLDLAKVPRARAWIVTRTHPLRG